MLTIKGMPDEFNLCVWVLTLRESSRVRGEMMGIVDVLLELGVGRCNELLTRTTSATSVSSPPTT